MSILPRTSLLIVLALLAGCGESERSKEIGKAPKQTIDRVTTDVNKALTQGSERTKEAEK